MKLDMALYKALVAAGVPEKNAHDVSEALEFERTSLLASKTDVTESRHDLKLEITAFRAEMKSDLSKILLDASTLRGESKDTALALNTSLMMINTKMDAMSHKLTVRLFQSFAALALALGTVTALSIKYLA
ncbi:hypothetical protein ACMGT0_20280 [Pseudomonas sp. RHF3.3-3]|uniref:DUF1640 domain-containing protein n=1 Tax=Pseudomonas asplenii TaxID=53407 RepID=A0A0N0VJG7_9PSED|nr:hypothetical protein [Pseudomonas fuscovaginae]KPA90351.1 hypothetical protein PF66_03159 [Pseudomonas fuscovaginae]